MEIKKLTDFAARNSRRISDNNLAGYDEEKKILHATVKANEEMGELCDAVLKQLGSQRKSKLKDFDTGQVGHEASDVIFTVLILAHLTGVDIEKALEEKMDKIDNRYDTNGKEV